MGFSKDFNNNIKNNVDTILKSANDIKVKAQIIENRSNKILDNILYQIENKVKRYSIEKQVPTLKKITN